MKTIPVVLDANVLASAPFAEDGPLQRLAELWESRAIEAYVSDHIWNELLKTYAKKYWMRRLPKAILMETLDIVSRRVHRIEITEVVTGIASHAQDDPVVATAVSARAVYLITGDKELRAVGNYRGVKIRTPQEFLEEFDPLA